MDLSEIKNIIFDLGNVIININHHNAILAFQNLMGKQFNELEKSLKKNEILEKYETAEISTKEFILFFKKIKPTLTDQEIIDAWNSMLLNLPEERLTLIEELTKKYRIFLLSNTNEIHLQWINNYVSHHFNKSSISSLFEKAYFSYEMGLRKPNSAIFEELLMDKNLIAEETLFIDDAEEHIITAKQLNLKTHHLLTTETIVAIFNEN